jgi:hypothetical protein
MQRSYKKRRRPASTSIYRSCGAAGDRSCPTTAPLHSRHCPDKRDSTARLSGRHLWLPIPVRAFTPKWGLSESFKSSVTSAAWVGMRLTPSTRPAVVGGAFYAPALGPDPHSPFKGGIYQRYNERSRRLGQIPPIDCRLPPEDLGCFGPRKWRKKGKNQGTPALKFIGGVSGLANEQSRMQEHPRDNDNSNRSCVIDPATRIVRSRDACRARTA